jgi:hypothetical protein
LASGFQGLGLADICSGVRQLLIHCFSSNIWINRFYDGCAADRGLALLVRSYRDGWGGENSLLPQAWELAGRRSVCPAIQCAALAKTLSSTRPILKSRAKKIPAVGTCEDFCCCV